MFLWPEPQTEFVPGVFEPAPTDENWYFVFHGSDIHMSLDTDGSWLPLSERPSENVLSTHYLGKFGDIACHVVEVEVVEESERAQYANLRALFGKVDNFLFSLAGRAVQVLDWHRSHQFCGSCGQKTQAHEKDRARVCLPCKGFYYPRLSPSIITLVHKGDELLLARNHRFPKGMYSTLAGFVEPGESIENTLRREVKEEVGVSVGKLEYLGSQPWPFPNSLMLGFLAEYESGDFVLQEEEISDAQWFHHSELPSIPGKVAISRWIIDTYLERLGVPSPA